MNIKKTISLSLAAVALAGQGAVARGAVAQGPGLPESKTFNEIVTSPVDESVISLFNSLKPEEKIFAYYLFRASLSGNLIAMDQSHRYTVQVLEIFETIIKNKEKLLKKKDELAVSGINIDLFLDDATNYLVNLWTNHGPYFKKEFKNEKRTPGRLGLSSLTKKSLIAVLESLEISDVREKIEKLKAFIFDENYEPTSTVPGSIDKSAANFYSEGFTDEDYVSLSPEERSGLNKYFSVVVDKDGQRKLNIELYKIGGKYGKELGVACYWLQKAHEHVKKFPETFDKHLVKSFGFLIEYLETGDEEFFRKHSIEWVKSNSRIDFTFGFIEQYDDPKGERGNFESDVTVKSFDITKLTEALPSFEKTLPVSEEFKRDKVAVPNASINDKLFGLGLLGPLRGVAAYCLPNYNDIRSEYGSKQIIYKQEKGLAISINPELYKKLFYLEDSVPDESMERDLWTLQVILHETIGHGSGKLADSVTDETLKTALTGYGQTIEELRAEIIALYVGVFRLSDLNRLDFLSVWIEKFGEEKMQEWLIWKMANSGLTRLVSQDEKTGEISGDHARADCTILNYLVEAGGVEIVEETKIIDGKTFTVLGSRVIDFEKAKEAIKELLILVQTIKSTADGVAAKNLIEKYGKKESASGYIKIIKDNQKSVVGDIKASAAIVPDFIPVLDDAGEVVEVTAQWPLSFVEQQLAHSELSLSKEISR
ncbi:hypothetical protein KAT92_01085 [Candidatus Babeliales bacterium]|nr:hypothetical protein [Candidatus Babeliales bacterium]